MEKPASIKNRKSPLPCFPGQNVSIPVKASAPVYLEHPDDLAHLAGQVDQGGRLFPRFFRLLPGREGGRERYASAASVQALGGPPDSQAL